MRLQELVVPVEAGPQLQDGGGVGDVLRGGTPVHPLAQVVRTGRDDLLDDAEYRVTDQLGAATQQLHVRSSPGTHLRAISAAASVGMIPSSASAAASAASMSR